MSDELRGEGAGGRREALTAGGLSIVISVAALTYLVPRGIGPIGSDPTVLAMIGSFGLGAFGILLVVSGLRMPAAESATRVDGGSRLRATGLMVICLVYAFALDWVGFMAASYVALAVLMLLLGVRSILALLLVPAGVLLGIYVGIELALGARLPEGSIEWPFPWQGGSGSLNG